MASEMILVKKSDWEALLRRAPDYRPRFHPTVLSKTTSEKTTPKKKALGKNAVKKTPKLDYDRIGPKTAARLRRSFAEARKKPYKVYTPGMFSSR